jgi:hypothetical protein
MKNLFKHTKRMFIILFLTLLGLFLILISILLIYNSGKPKLFLDKNAKPKPGSISEKIHVNINGMKQGMIIKSKDSTHPILLYLHGGLPDYFLSIKYPIGLEEYFTMVWWERYGSGLSFNADISPEAITLEQLISDTKEVTNYLRKRFGVGKNLPHETIWRLIHWHTSCCTNTRVVPCIYCSSADDRSTKIVNAGIQIHA